MSPTFVCIGISPLVGPGTLLEMVRGVLGKEGYYVTSTGSQGRVQR